ncbi:DUF1194 domain-containing protein [Pelagibius sp. 7325]|uniref:DUF1194 domain-containing protein n=1 Tax=Pelagibius sp. 7325 TaxID=3131994 RepID=UPI0030EE3C75
MVRTRRRAAPAALAATLAAALLIATLRAQPTQAQQDLAVDLELVLAVDVSLSIDTGEARLQRQGYVEAFRDPDVLQAIRGGILGRIAVTYFEWANSAHTHMVVGWTVIDSEASAETFAAALAKRRPGPAHYTSISGAIDFGARLFDDNGFEGTRQVIDVSGDGPNNWGDLVVHARDRAVDKGITINGLPILDPDPGPYARYNIPNLDLYFRDCVIGGPAAFIVAAEGFDSFASAIRRKLILEIAGLTPAREPAQGPAQGSERHALHAVTPRLQLAQFSGQTEAPLGQYEAEGARVAPPCDIGEQLLRSRQEDF